MSEIFPDGTMKKLDDVMAAWHENKSDEAIAGIGLVLAAHDIHKSNTTDPALTIAILQGYLRAVLALEIPKRGKVKDLLLRHDEKLCVGVVGMVGEEEELVALFKDIRDRHGKTLDKLAPPELKGAREILAKVFREALQDSGPHGDGNDHALEYADLAIKALREILPPESPTACQDCLASPDSAMGRLCDTHYMEAKAKEANQIVDGLLDALKHIELKTRTFGSRLKGEKTVKASTPHSWMAELNGIALEAIRATPGKEANNGI